MPNREAQPGELQTLIAELQRLEHSKASKPTDKTTLEKARGWIESFLQTTRKDEPAAPPVTSKERWAARFLQTDDEC